MKPGKTERNRAGRRVAQTAIAGMAFALLVACGGSHDVAGGASGTSGTASPGSTGSTGSTGSPAPSPPAPPPGGVTLQTVSFGDSLSDVGTYAWFAAPNFSGGEFTTNPGAIWAQDVALYYGGTLAPAYSDGLTLTTPAALGGLGYAQGGARVTLTPGVGAPPLSAVPVATQIHDYLSTYGGFTGNQLVLIQGGANDILSAAQLIEASPTNPTVIATQEAAIEQAAIDLAQDVGTLLSNGATKVVLVNVPDLGETPLGVSAADGGALLTSLSAGFNTALKTALTTAGILNEVIYVDAFSFIDNTITNAALDGFAVTNTATACDLTRITASATAYGETHTSVLGSMTPQQFGQTMATSLLCSPQMQVSSDASETYMFADTLRPTTHLHLLLAQQVEQQIAAAGIGH